MRDDVIYKKRHSGRALNVSCFLANGKNNRPKGEQHQIVRAAIPLSFLLTRNELRLLVESVAAAGCSKNGALGSAADLSNSGLVTDLTLLYCLYILQYASPMFLLLLHVIPSDINCRGLELEIANRRELEQIRDLSELRT